MADAIELEAAQNAANGSRAALHVGGDTAAGPALSPKLFHLLHQVSRCRLAQAMGTRTAVPQPRWSLGAIAPHPFGSCFGADAERGCSRVQRQLLDHNFCGQGLSTPRRKSGILMKVHSSLPDKQIGLHLQL